MRRQFAGVDDDAYGTVADAAGNAGIPLDTPAPIDMSEFEEVTDSPDTLDDALHMGSGLRSDIAEGLQGGEHPKYLAGLRNAKDAIDASLFDAIEDPVARKRFLKLKDLYNNEYNDRFDTALSEKGQTPGEQIAAKFWKPDSKRGTPAAQWYRYVFRDNPQALDDLVGAAADDLRRHSLGEINKVPGWEKMHADSLRSFPEIESMVKHDPLELMRSRAAHTAGTADRAEDADLHKAMSEYGLKPRLKDAMEIMGKIGDRPRAVTALKRAVWSSAYAKRPSTAALEKFGEDNRQPLTKIMGRDHLDNIISTMGHVRMASGGLVDPRDEIHHHLPGLGKREGATLLMSSFSNPDVARDLANATRERGASAKQFRRLYGHLMTRGLA